MNNNLIKYCDFVSELFECSYYIRENILFIHAKESLFKIHLTDNRLPQYTLFHKNAHKIKETYHVQYRNRSIKKCIFVGMVHDFNKGIGVFYNSEDYNRVLYDSDRYIKDIAIKEVLIDKCIICPICGKTHRCIGSKGELRKEIHCRCYINKHHSKFRYVYSKGYYLYYANKQIIKI